MCRLRNETSGRQLLQPQRYLLNPLSFFGLTNLLAMFQAMMNELLRDLINMGKVASFIDDVIIGTEGEEKHNEIVEEVVKRLVENDLYIKPEKYKWKVKKVEFLGVVIGKKGIKMEEEKIKVIVDWPVPKSVKEVQKFLGLANYYQRFIEGFAKVAKLLHELMSKEQKWKWEIRQECYKMRVWTDFGLGLGLGQ